MKRKDTSKWLEGVKSNSWESEILIVGFVLIILLQTKDIFPLLIDNMTTFNSLNNGVYSLANKLIIPFLLEIIYIANLILVVNLSFYLLIRGLWVGIIGLSSVFPDGVDINKLNYNQLFTNQLFKYDLDTYSHRVDYICSSIFSISFLFIMVLLSVGFFIIETIILILFIDYITEPLLYSELYFFQLLPDFIRRVISYAMGISLGLFFVLGFIYIIDFILLSPLKLIKNKYFGIIYNSLNRLFRITFIIFIYEMVYLTFVSNLKKRYIYLFVFLVVSLTSLIARWEFMDNSFYDTHSSQKFFKLNFNYENLLENSIMLNENREMKNKGPIIQSDIINESFIRLFIPYESNYDAYFKNCIDDSLTIDEMNRDKFLVCVDKFFLVSIDDDAVLNLDYTYFTHYIENRKGFNTIFLTDGLSKGNHILKIKSPVFYEEFKTKGVIEFYAETEGYLNYSIPFYYTGSK